MANENIRRGRLHLKRGASSPASYITPWPVRCSLGNLPSSRPPKVTSPPLDVEVPSSHRGFTPPPPAWTPLLCPFLQVHLGLQRCLAVHQEEMQARCQASRSAVPRRLDFFPELNPVKSIRESGGCVREGENKWLSLVSFGTGRTEVGGRTSSSS